MLLRSSLLLWALLLFENHLVAETLPAAVGLAVLGNFLAVEALTFRSLISESLAAVASLLDTECFLVAVESLAAAANLAAQSSTA